MLGKNKSLFKRETSHHVFDYVFKIHILIKNKYTHRRAESAQQPSSFSFFRQSYSFTFMYHFIHQWWMKRTYLDLYILTSLMCTYTYTSPTLYLPNITIFWISQNLVLITLWPWKYCHSCSSGGWELGMLCIESQSVKSCLKLKKQYFSAY